MVKLKDLKVRLWRPCTSCGGTGRVPGGQREYGELIQCPLCDKGRVPCSLSWERFVHLIHEKRLDLEIDFDERR